jgi:pyrimidine deaminase RibD-like protein
MLWRCCVAKPKPFDGMTIVALKMDANGKIVLAKVHQSSGDPKADADALHRAKAEINSLRLCKTEESSE